MQAQVVAPPPPSSFGGVAKVGDNAVGKVGGNPEAGWVPTPTASSGGSRGGNDTEHDNTGNSQALPTEQGTFQKIETEKGVFQHFETEKGNSQALETEKGTSQYLQTEKDAFPYFETENGTSQASGMEKSRDQLWTNFIRAGGGKIADEVSWATVTEAENLYQAESVWPGHIERSSAAPWTLPSVTALQVGPGTHGTGSLQEIFSTTQLHTGDLGTHTDEPLLMEKNSMNDGKKLLAEENETERGSRGYSISSEETADLSEDDNESVSQCFPPEQPTQVGQPALAPSVGGEAGRTAGRESADAGTGGGGHTVGQESVDAAAGGGVMGMDEVGWASSLMLDISAVCDSGSGSNCSSWPPLSVGSYLNTEEALAVFASSPCELVLGGW